MAYKNLEEIYAAMDATRARLIERVSSLNPEQETTRAIADAWSVAEIVEHLSSIEKQIARLISLMLMKAESVDAAPNPGPPVWPVSLEKIEERSRREKYQAPETVRPRGDVSIKDSLAAMQTSRATLHDLKSRLDTMNGASVSYPHPVFGSLNLYEWLVMLALHEERHLRQIDATLLSVPGAVAAGSQ